MHWVLYDLHLITTQIRPGFHIYIVERSFCLILYIIIVIRHIPRCVIRHLLHFGLSYICIYQPILLHPNTLRFLYRLGVVETRASSIPRAHTRECHGNWHHPISIVVQNTTLTPTIKWETRLYQGMSHMYLWCQHNGHDIVWLITRSMLLRPLGYRLRIILYNCKCDVCFKRGLSPGLKCARWD